MNFEGKALTIRSSRKEIGVLKPYSNEAVESYSWDDAGPID
jgi:hypothetical protein